ncbi:hypothetical protein [Pseudopedobacter beijingensis]|uniref:HlyD family secretion protein n=1 Tax=Pseudopedobacter beijingensis TaxID=1207056 RepID=A0ABW4I7G7_9SPHI
MKKTYYIIFLLCISVCHAAFLKQWLDAGIDEKKELSHLHPKKGELLDSIPGKVSQVVDRREYPVVVKVLEN